MTLKDYLKEAESIAKFTGLKPTDEIIGMIAGHIIKAESKYNSDIGTVQAFRWFCGKRFAYDYKKKKALEKKKRKVYHISTIQFAEDKLKSNDNVVENVIFNQALEYIETLEPRTKDVISRHYYHNETLESIGKSYNITRERVRQIINAGLEEVREQLK